MRHAMLVLGCLTLLPACSMEPDSPAPSPGGSGAAVSVGGTVPGAIASASATASAAGASRSEKISNDLMEFEYTYPAQAGAIPALKQWFDQDLDKRKRELEEDAKEQRAEAKKEGYPYRTLGYWATWKTVTDLPGWLSLSAEISTYEGGAHPNHGFEAVLWDKQGSRRFDPDDMFTSEAALSRVIRKDFCRALDRERVKKRGGAASATNEISDFVSCIDPMDSTLILGSSNGKAFDRIGILVPPYEAGPYAEGSYEVTLPVTAAVLATVRPEFRPAFMVGR